MSTELIKSQDAELIKLLWDYMKRDPEHRDRVCTDWGTKTKQGLVASIRRVLACPRNTEEV